MYPKFRDAFIRMVHAPGRYMSDAERLRYLIGSLRGSATTIAATYTSSHGEGNYHHVTAALEAEYYKPFQACRMLHKYFLELRPKSGTAVELNRFAANTIGIVRLLRDYDDYLNHEKLAVEAWMEKISQAARLEMCRYLEPTSRLSLEDVVRALQKYTSWQQNAYVFSDSCGLGAQYKNVSGGLQAILAPPSSDSPTIVEVPDDDRTGGFFGIPRGQPDVSAAVCPLCGQRGHHWAPRCPVFKTSSERIARAKELQFCLLCLRKGHSIGDRKCRARQTTCRFCRNATHHKALCSVYLEQYLNGTRANDRQPNRQHLERSQGGIPPSQPETGRCNPEPGAKNGKASGHRRRSGPGAGRRAYGGGTTAKDQRASGRPCLATHAATTSIEEPADGLTEPSTTTTEVPDSSSGQRKTVHHKVASPPETQKAASPPETHGAFSPPETASNGIGHESDAPTDPDTDEEDHDYDAFVKDALLDGVDTFGAAVPSWQEHYRTHLLECVQAEVFNPVDPTRMKTAIVFFDCGSSKTFVSDDVAADLGLINLGRKELTLDTFANDKPVTLDTFQTKFGLVTTNRERIVLDAAASPKVVRQLRAAFISPEDARELRRNNCTLIPEHVAPDIVIGRDTQHHFRKKDLLPVLPSGFCLVQSTLGTMVAGLGSIPKFTGGSPSANLGAPSPSSPDTSPGKSQEVGAIRCSSFFVTASGDEDSQLEKMAENFWKTENIGIEPNTQTPDDQLAHERFKQTTTIDNEGRYQCRLPWKTPDGLPPSNVVLPTNHAVARGRLTSFQRSHLHEPEFLLKYGEGFTTMEHDAIIEKFDSTKRNSAMLHLLAHHAVLKESSATTKVRHVFDGSAKLPGKPAINDLLHRGPVLLPKMAAILIRTRLSQLLLIADIARAFLQVSLHPDDRSACAFLWLKDALKPPTDDNLIYYRFRRVPFGLKPSPFLLGATIEMHLEKIGTPLAKEIWSNCYVDNVILGADSLEEALEKYRLSKEYFASAKMQLRQFASNSADFNDQLPPEDAAEFRHLMNLGYEWDVASDCWLVSLAAKPAKGKPKGRKRRRPADVGVLTKRRMLQRLARITDPIGYLQPTLLPVKLAIQEAWIADPDWNDEPLPAALSELWEEATKDFEATTIEIPRRIAPSKIDELEVHIYVDASKEAYGFATYLRAPSDSHYTTSLVFSRTKVKPIKAAEKMTIPRMELMAFLLGARQARFMAETLEFSRVRRTIIWSDSMIVLQQIRTPTNRKRFSWKIG
ncbi:Pao retrotransposon peptidase family protein [Aphelenchoides avenae]|nr:Pao retrotransposon peptidase family protein [Aphelenchus avenae]